MIAGHMAGSSPESASGEARRLCTMADSGYLHFVLALHASLREHSPDWPLSMVCLDEAAYQVLSELELSGLNPIRFEELLQGQARPGDRPRGAAIR